MATKPKGPAERRYHKLAVALWSDRAFRALSERAKLLYYRLAAGPETLPVPGVARLSRAGLAIDELRWGLDEFDARLDELVQAGLAEVDLAAGLVVLPRELAEPFSMPQGLPSVTSWRRGLANAPDCELLDVVRERVIYSLATNKGPRWVETFLTPGDQGQDDQVDQAPDENSPQTSLFVGKVAPLQAPKVQIQNQIQNQKPKQGGIAQAAGTFATARPSQPPPPPPVESVDLEDLPDLTRWAVEERPLPPPVPQLPLPAEQKRPPVRPARPVKSRSAHRADPLQTALPLMAAPDPEHCASVITGKAGALFAHGPLLPGDTALGGVLHPSVRREWARVLSEYFGPLNYSAAQVDDVLAKLGQWIAWRGETVTLQVLCKFRGERLQQYVAAALAWNGGQGSRPSRPPAPSASEESRRYPLRDKASRSELAEAAVVGAAQRQLSRVLQSETDPQTKATAESALAQLRALIGLRSAA